eukprot:10409755-Heterocapsa_arctica.AAC.1
MARSGHSYNLREHGQLYYLPAKLGKVMSPIVNDMLLGKNKEIIGKKPWILFEWSCESDSRLAHWFVDHGHAARRLGLPQTDLKTPRVVDGVVQEIIEAYDDGFDVILWASLPCTAWCTWQH